MRLPNFIESILYLSLIGFAPTAYALLPIELDPSLKKDSRNCVQLSLLSPSKMAEYDNMGTVDFNGLADSISQNLSPTCISLDKSKLGAYLGDETSALRVGARMSSRLRIPLLLQAGVYLVSSRIPLKSYTTIDGIDGGATIRLSSPSYAILEATSEASNIRLLNLTLEEGAGVTSGALFLRGKNKLITVANVNFSGNPSLGGLTAAGIYSDKDFVDYLTVSNCKFRAFPFGINLTSFIHRARIEKNEFTEWTHYALIANSLYLATGSQSKHIIVDANNFHSPAAGPVGQSLFKISRGVFHDLVENVTFVNNVVIGSQTPYVPATRGMPGSDALGDMIVLFGVDGFLMENNDVRYGGENAVTIEILSRNGVIKNNKFYGADAYALNIGLSYQELIVSDSHPFMVGDFVQGTNSGVYGKIENIFDNTLVLSSYGFSSASGGIFENGEPLKKVIYIFEIDSSGKKVATLLSEEATNASLISFDRVRDITVEGNEIKDNARNLGGEKVLWEIMVNNADNIVFKNNQISSSIHTPGIDGYNSFVINMSRNITIYSSNHILNMTNPMDAVLTSRSTFSCGRRTACIDGL